mmetsp:Transcript_30797/g.40688  ORF Transcript_30797/g.40688 Transcript_30797/m.40688 type:complete len:644 (-) Transcript_30797:435-2366(-)
MKNFFQSCTDCTKKQDGVTIDETYKLQRPSEEKGMPPFSDGRKITDVIPLILLVSVWICTTVVGGLSCEQGYPSRLFSPMDSNGRLCGVDDTVESKPNIYYISSESDGKFLLGTCVEKCPTSEVNVTSIEDLICLEGVDFEGVVTVDDVVSGSYTYCNYQYPTREVLQRCIFDDDDIMADFKTENLTGVLEEFAADLYIARNYIFGLGVSLTLILAFSFSIFPRIKVKGALSFLLWIAVLLIAVALLGTSAFMVDTAQQWETEIPRIHQQFEINGLRGLGWTFFVLLIVYIVAVIIFRRTIHLSAQVVSEASKGVVAMPLMVLFPLLQVLGLLLYLIPWSTYMIYTAGISKLERFERGDGYVATKVNWSKEVEYRSWFFFFSLWWTAEFIIAVGQITLSLCFMRWYFLKNNKHIGNMVIFSSLKEVIVHHLGTAALGSLVIVPIKPFRALLYEMKRAKESKGNVLGCCIGWLDNCLVFLHRDAYVQTAMSSHSFWHGGRVASYLLQRNISKIRCVGFLPEVLIYIARAFVSFIASFLTFCGLRSAIPYELSSVISPTIVSFVISYWIATMFTMIYQMGMSTIFQCWCADEEMFGGHYCSADLDELLTVLTTKRKSKSFIRLPSFKKSQWRRNSDDQGESLNQV